MSKKYIGIIIVLTCSFLLLPQNIYSSSIKEDYELQEKCGKLSEELFTRFFGNGIVDDGRMIATYQSHYNRRLNKCFLILNTTTHLKNQKADVLYIKRLFDRNENREYGYFSSLSKQVQPLGCRFLGKSCKSEIEWDLLVRPYMEE